MPTAAFQRRVRKMALPNAAKNIINTIATVAIAEGIAAPGHVRNQEWRSTYPMAKNGRGPTGSYLRLRPIACSVKRNGSYSALTDRNPTFRNRPVIPVHSYYVLMV